VCTLGMKDTSAARKWAVKELADSDDEVNISQLSTSSRISASNILQSQALW
jgi:hypothetical protein